MGLVRAFHTTMLPLSVLLFVTGVAFGDLLISLCAVLLLFMVNMAFGFSRISSRAVFIYFHIAIALFLLSRPAIDLMKGDVWFGSTYAATLFSLSALFLTLFFLYAGVSFAEWRQSLRDGCPSRRRFGGSLIVRGEPRGEGIQWFHTKSRTEKTTRPKKRFKVEYVRAAALFVFICGLVGMFWLGAIKLSYMSGREYTDYYLINLSEYAPVYVRTLATMAPYALCAYLATLPSKKPATIALVLNILTSVPMLIIGSRGDFVITILFAILYYVLRDFTDGKGTWFGRFEKTILVICLPFGTIAMGLLTYIRADTAIVNFGFLTSFIDAIYGQGVSYDVLDKGFTVNNQIASLGFKFYTFGPLIDYITQGPFGRYILGIDPLGSANSVKLAVEGFSYSHAMSYFAHPRYLMGEGYGSSYLLETYTDFGYLGIGVFSFLFGMILSYLPRFFHKGGMWGTLSLVICFTVFHMPRGSALEWIKFIWTPQFWFTIVVIYVIVFALQARAFRGFTIGGVSWLQRDGLKCAQTTQDTPALLLKRQDLILLKGCNCKKAVGPPRDCVPPPLRV